MSLKSSARTVFAAAVALAAGAAPAVLGPAAHAAGADHSAPAPRAASVARPMDSRAGQAISRSTVMARAESWIAEGVPYSQEQYWTDSNGTYRQDCSGFISMAWDLPSGASNNYGETTQTLPGFATQLGGYDELQPGDMLDNISEHVVLFKGWTDSGHTTADILEEPHTGATAREDDSYYTRGYLAANGYKPYRYNNISDSGTAPGGSPIIGTGDINRTGVGDFLARGADGHLYSYMGKGDGTFTGRTDLGGGWNQYDLIVGAGDINRTSVPDLLARDRNGHLWSYMGKGDGTFTGRTDLGGGWNQYDLIVGVGDMNGTGVADLLAREPDGDLYIYMGIGDGTFTGRTKIGHGFDIYDTIVGAGDINRTSVPDLLAR
ncbi:FG-GAP-like repeat-containing protein, partial [Kitasatospora sp. MBT63]|uniref:C40 family peptidase n=1 Tax=Kitasatospora sp. MBT63 TaxID=1444768 RepID=UPI001E3220E3